MENADVCVVVRMYNEASVVGPVVAELTNTFANVVCVDDGSTDGSGDIARNAGALVVTHPVNLGGGAALKTGLEFARRATHAAYFVTFDADGQHRVQDAVAMVAHARARQLDVVLGSRFLGVDSDMPRARRVLLRSAALFTRATTGVDLTDAHNGLRVLSRTFVDSLRLTITGMGYASELIAALSAPEIRHDEFPVTVLYTEYSLGKGQRNLNSVNIVVDLALTRLWSPA
jgi:polyprenyl-phospho-N-acetylgalactosaminyl synthase